MSRADLQDIKEAYAFAKQAVLVMAGYAKQEFNLPKDFKIKTRIKTARPILLTKAETESCGGYIWDARLDKAVPYVHLKVGIVFLTKRFREYGAYRSKPEIGTIRNSTRKTAILAMIAHEIAHTVQFAMRIEFGRDVYQACAVRGLPEFEDDHGELFQEIYRRLRRKFVNKGRQEIKISA